MTKPTQTIPAIAHTQGEWTHGHEFEPGKYSLTKVISVASGGAVIAHVNCGFGNGEANASLIATAPALLALAKQYASECGECAGVGIDIEDHDCAECKFIRDVIAKAVKS